MSVRRIGCDINAPGCPDGVIGKIDPFIRENRVVGDINPIVRFGAVLREVDPFIDLSGILNDINQHNRLPSSFFFLEFKHPLAKKKRRLTA
jgi:hypothetical protein